MARPKTDKALYFPHDHDMRNDRGVKALRKQFKSTGYAVYCMLLETLTDSNFFRIKFSDIEVALIAADFDIERKELVEIIAMASKFGLFQYKSGVLSCPALEKRLSPVLEKRKKAAAAYQKKKGSSSVVSDTEMGLVLKGTAISATETTQGTAISATETTQSKVNKSKVNKSKVNKSKVCIYKKQSGKLLAADFSRILSSPELLDEIATELKLSFGEAERWVIKISNYCSSKGYQYQNLIATIKNWRERAASKSGNLSLAGQKTAQIGIEWLNEKGNHE